MTTDSPIDYASHIALLVLSVTKRSEAVAALVAGAAALVALALPHKLGLVAAAVTGLAVGLIWRRHERGTQ